MYIYSYLFCPYWCKDCCHRVTTQLQLVVVVIIIIIIIMLINEKFYNNNNNNNEYLKKIIQILLNYIRTSVYKSYIYCTAHHCDS